MFPTEKSFLSRLNKFCRFTLPSLAKTSLMRKIICLFALLFTLQYSYADEVSISSQMEWDDYMSNNANIVLASDELVIASTATITNNGTFTNNGTITNNGTFTNTGDIINNGTINNIGTFNNNFGLGNTGTINNTGAFNINFGIFNSGTFNTCSNLGVIFINPPNIAPNAPGLVGALCDDDNPDTEGEIILSQDPECVCGIPPSPIPTLSQWGLIILGLCLSIIGVVVIRQKYIVLS